MLVQFPARAQDDCPRSGFRSSISEPRLEDAINPVVSDRDFVLPMPGGAQLVLRHVGVPAHGYFDGSKLTLGCSDCGRPGQTFMDARHINHFGGSFLIDDLPEGWKKKLEKQVRSGDGNCTSLEGKPTHCLFYFIGKYEITGLQWQRVMEAEADRGLKSEDPRPITDVSWFDAVEFTRRYTEWLLKNHPHRLPGFKGGRYAYIRLPTEVEWEYAARGGHLVSISEFEKEPFFPMRGKAITDYAVFTDSGSARLPEKPAWIGTRCPNPLGIYDTAGNASEMMIDLFRFSIESQLGGAAGGFIIKGGSFRKRLQEIKPGRREELPLFLNNGAFRSRDVGFRVVLSAIVTPEDRMADMNQQWARFKSDPTVMAKTDGNNKDLNTLIQSLMNKSDQTIGAADLADIQKSIRENQAALEAQKVETVTNIIRSALFSLESAASYADRRKTLLNELGKLEQMRNDSVSDAVVKALNKAIDQASETVAMFDEALDYLVETYMNRVMDCRKYPPHIVDLGMDFISQELPMSEQGFSQTLKSRSALIKKHIDLKGSSTETISIILKDIIPPAAK